MTQTNFQIYLNLFVNNNIRYNLLHWICAWANILWLTDTFPYLSEFSGIYHKVNINIYWIEVLPFVELKESIIGNFQTIYSTEDIAQFLRDLQTVQNVCKSRKSCALSPDFIVFENI